MLNYPYAHYLVGYKLCLCLLLLSNFKVFKQYKLLILLLHVLLTVIFVILLLLSVMAALHTGLTITCYNSWQEANLDVISY